MLDAANDPCPAPLPLLGSLDFKLPRGACDSHAHVIASDFNLYPLTQQRSYTPAVASENQYLGMLDGLGFDRGVLVQPSVYGTDNRYLLEVLARHSQRLRGVAVVPPDSSEGTLAHLHEQGVRGIRFNLLFRGGLDLGLLEPLAARVAAYGWHIQLLIDVRDLPQLADRLIRLPCPVVIDHMGHLPASEGVRNPGFRLLLEGLKQHGWWVKLSGAYRLGAMAPDYAEADPLAAALIAANPARLVWGSDWPHVAQKSMPDTVRLLNRLAVWAPDSALRRRILVDNPRELYDFH